MDIEITMLILLPIQRKLSNNSVYLSESDETHEHNSVCLDSSHHNPGHDHTKDTIGDFIRHHPNKIEIEAITTHDLPTVKFVDSSDSSDSGNYSPNI